MVQKSAEYIHTQTALDIKLNLDAVARKYDVKKLCYITKDL